MRRVAPPFIALVALPLLGLVAQARPSVEVGRTVRLKTESVSHWLVGTLVALDGDSLRVQRAADGTVVAIGQHDVTRLQIRSGRHSNWRLGAFIGCLIGGASGGIIGHSHGGAHDFLALSAEDKAILGGLAGAAGGVLVGGIIGAATHSDSWVAMPVRPAQVSLAPHGLGLAVSVRL